MKSKIIYFLRKVLRIEKFEKIAQATSNFEYLTPEYIADIENIAIDKAEVELNAAVKDGFMEKKHLFYALELQSNIFVEEEQIGTTIRVDDCPEMGRITDVFVVPEHTKEVYVAV